jgi:hypothetical protein
LFKRFHCGTAAAKMKTNLMFLEVKQLQLALIVQGSNKACILCPGRPTALTPMCLIGCDGSFHNAAIRSQLYFISVQVIGGESELRSWLPILGCSAYTMVAYLRVSKINIIIPW